MDTWHIEETRRLIARTLGQEQLELAKPPLRSVIDRQEYGVYHYREAKRLFEAFKVAHLSDSQLIEVVFSDQDHVLTAFQEFVVSQGAHVLACVQSLHAMGDILAHVAYFSLGLNEPGRQAEAAIYAPDVIKRLKKATDTQAVGDLLSKLINDDGFHHIAAIANSGKHHTVVRPSLTEDWTGTAPEQHYMLFEPMIYKDKPFPKIGVSELLETHMRRNARFVVDVGNAVDAVLLARGVA